MTRKSFETVIKKLVSYTKKIGAKIVFIGGIAISILTQPRTTYDIDFFISIDTNKIKLFLKQLAKMSFKPIKGMKIFPYFFTYFSQLQSFNMLLLIELKKLRLVIKLFI
ncbi:MAG: hypothetical protein RMJ13_01315 [Elusimicrobiota bacterium]|nr:hypothetical protein [Elusimicrobiota bacterium]